MAALFLTVFAIQWIAIERLPPSEKQFFLRGVVVGCRLALLAMVVTTLIVWLGYSAPAVMHGLSHPERGEALMHEDGHAQLWDYLSYWYAHAQWYHLIHGLVMIVTIPPVVSSLLCIYIFIALFSALHVVGLQARAPHPITHPRHPPPASPAPYPTSGGGPEGGKSVSIYF